MAVGERHGSRKLNRAGRSATAIAVAVTLALALGAPGALAAIDPPEPRIVGGGEVNPEGKYPFMVALVTHSNPNAHTGQFCGGAVVAASWVLTAGHCVQSKQPGDVDVVIGRHDLTSSDGERIAVDEILVHPNFNIGPGFLEFDGALLRLSTPTSFAPIVMASSGAADKFSPGTVATVMGWGFTESSPAFPNVLYEVAAPIISDADCEAAGAPGPLYAEDFDGSSMICAGYPAGGQDACAGDSGGPLVAPDGNGGWLHVGVVSWGYGCADPGAPGVYGETAALLEWVLSQLGPMDPVAVDDSGPGFTTSVDTAFTTGDVTANDMDDGALDPVTVVVAGPTPTGLTNYNDGTFHYDPPAGFVGTVTFDYSVDDLEGNTSNAATVTLAVVVGNAAPVAVDDQANATAGVPTTINVLANDSDPDGDVLSVAIQSQPSHGVVTLGSNAAVTYTAVDGFAGVDSFTYAASDGQMNSALATVTVNVAALIPPLVMANHGVGLVDPAQGLWTLRNGAGALNVFYFGNPDDVPFMGDWNCDGTETPGLFRPADGYVYLRLTNTQGPADIAFFAGNPDDTALAGDFNNDGCDTVSLYRSSSGELFIFNQLGSNDLGIGTAELSFQFGNLGDAPFVGDFDGDGVETVGLHRQSTGEVFLANSHQSGPADLSFVFGDGGDRFVAGDWTGDGQFTPGVFRPSTTTVYLKHANEGGMASEGFRLGEPHWLPVAGAF